MALFNHNKTATTATSVVTELAGYLLPGFPVTLCAAPASTIAAMGLPQRDRASLRSARNVPGHSGGADRGFVETGPDGGPLIGTQVLDVGFVGRDQGAATGQAPGLVQQRALLRGSDRNFARPAPFAPGILELDTIPAIRVGRD